MKAFNGYEDAKENAKHSGGGRLPAGAYVCKILGAKETPAKDGKSGFLTVQFDIAEGDYKDFFKKQHEANEREDKKYKGKTTVYIPKEDGSEKDEWTKTSFAKWTNSLEESNSGYIWDWDEKKWKDKLVGIVFGDTGTRIDGNDIVYTEARYPVSVEKVRAGEAGSAKFKAKGNYGKDSSDDFMNIPDDADEELPF